MQAEVSVTLFSGPLARGGSFARAIVRSPSAFPLTTLIDRTYRRDSFETRFLQIDSFYPRSERVPTRSGGGDRVLGVVTVREEGIWSMRLGLFGGTFDPIHLGHLILAEQCREACRLDRVWFVVAGAPPHKPGDRTAVTHRLEMVRIAIAGHASFAVSEIETMRPGPHYSVETLETVRRDQPDDDLFFLIGADSLADLPFWREPARIAGWPRSWSSIARAWKRSTRRNCPTSARALIRSCR